ncbi:hypothetical protein KDK77_03685 [bacterium]|nr:hypothetical protein [bacterium]
MNQIEQKLQYLRKKIRAHLVYSALKVCVISVFSYLFIGIPAGYFSGIPPTGFIIAAAIWVCGTVAVIIQYSIKPWLRTASLEKTARWIEKRIPLFGGTLISALQFSDPSYVKKYGLSGSLIEAHRTQADNGLHVEQIMRYPNFYPSVQPGKYWCALCALLVMPVMFYSDFYAESFYHTYRQFCCPMEQPPEYLFVRPGNARIVHGNRTIITAFIHTRLPEDYMIHLRIEQGGWRAYPLARHTRYRYTYDTGAVENTIHYFVSAGHLVSETYTIKPLVLPVPTEHRITFSPPSYTGWKGYTETRKQFEDIAGLEGTQITFSVTSTNPLRTASLVHADNESSEFELIENDTASHTFTLIDNDTYTLLLTDIHGQCNIPVKPYNLTALPDKSPHIAIMSPHEYSEMPRSMSVEILYESSDDIGIASISLTYQVDNESEHTIVLNTSPTGREISGSFEWDLTGIGISPGQTATFFLTAEDSFPAPRGPHRVHTPKHRILFPSLAQMYQRKTETFDQPVIDFEAVKSEHDMLLEQMKNLSSKVAGADSISWSDKLSMQTILQSQQNMQDEIEKMAQTLNTESRNQQLAQNIIEKFEEIQSITDSLLTDEMKESLAKLQKLIEQSEYYKQIEQQLEKTAGDMETYNEQLDRTLSLLKQLSIENKLQEMFEATRSMLENQDMLSEHLDNTAPQTSRLDTILTEQNQSLEYLQQSMNDLSEQMKETDENVSEQFNELKELFDNEGLAEQLKELASMIRQNNRQAAHSQSASFKSGVQKLNAGIDSLLKTMKEQRNMLLKISFIISRIMRMKEELHRLSVAIEQHHGKNKIRNIEHAKQLFFIQTELKRIGSAASVLGKNSTIVSPDYYRDFFDAADRLGEYNEKVFKKGDMKSLQAIDIAQTMLNRSAIKWIRLLEMIQRFQQQSGDGQGMPQPDMERFFNQLNQLANQQGALNKQTAQIPGMMPSMHQQMGQYMHRLAAQQKMLADALAGLNQSYATGQRVLGDLNQIQRAMEEAAASLSIGDVSPELIERQQQIHTRLLEAEKSLRTREKSEERESKPAEQLKDTDSPKELEHALLERIRQKVMNRSERGYVPPHYRKMVEDYFLRLIELQGTTPQTH